MNNIEEISKEFENDRALELFGRIETSLLILERQKLNEYINDYLNPKWKRIYIDGEETHYEISNIGKVRNTDTGLIIAPQYTNQGRVLYDIWKNNKVYKRQAHRLVAYAFIKNDDPENKIEVDHLYPESKCNWYKALEWVTPEENKQRAIDMGLIGFPLIEIRCGEDSFQAKYSNKEIEKLCKYWEKHPNTPPSEISKVFNIPVYILNNIRNGSWRAVSSKYTIPTTCFNYGENHIGSVYSDNQIREVCELLMNPDNTYTYIEKCTGVKKDTIFKVFNHEERKDIANKYNFPNRTGKKKSDMTLRIEDLFLNKKSSKDVTDIIMKEFDIRDKSKCQYIVGSVKYQMKKFDRL